MKNARFLLATIILAACGRAKSEKPLFYYDLGPSEVNIAGYPANIQAAYLVFREKCSACHTLARPLNAPYVDSKDWLSYLYRMEYRGTFSNQIKLTAKDQQAIQDFLAYDTQERKIKNKEAFLKQEEALKERFLQLGP